MPQTQSEHYKKLRRILAEMFQLDQAELDFGIYRIMNQKREEINDFLDNELLTQIHDTLTQSGETSLEETKKELQNLERTLRGAGVDVDTNEKVQELREEIARGGSTEALELEVYSRLTQFFKRYYKEGDFISQRRYKEGVYAIPYEGEEVKLYWANHDQYYIKTGEDFKDYSFRLGDAGTVHFTLKEADTEKDNNKEQSGKERRFQLYEDSVFEEINGDLHIYFTYEPTEKKIKQDQLNGEALKTLFEVLPGKWTQELLQLKPTTKNKKRTLLEYRLNDYTARNTFDYFIHKDLEGFLKRELDFYIKNEILHIDDIDLDDEQHFQKQLLLIKALKKVAHKIIDFLAQIENFQKKLWLKKKMVLQSDYCITLDRVDEDFYEEIASNEQQHREWIDLFAIDDLEDYTEELSVDFLKNHPFLLLDTQFFPREFKYRLLATIPDIDAQCDGLLIKSENFQALNLLQERYREKVEAVYIDPPYNTGSDNDFAYKDDFQSSSWASLMANRFERSREMMKELSGIYISTDDGEYANLKLVMDTVFGKNNFIADVIWNSRKSISSDALISLATNHTTFYAKNQTILNDNKANYRLPESKEGFINPDKDPRGPWKLDPMDAPNIRENLSYGIKNPNTGQVFYPPKGRCWRFEEQTVLELIEDNRILFGKTGKAKPGFKRFYEEIKDKGRATNTLWLDVKTTTSATKLLYNFFGDSLSRDFLNRIKPKPTQLIERVFLLSGNHNSLHLDYFAGSGTSANAVININRELNETRKYILVEMGEYFDTVTKPRIQKVIYSDEWKNGKPTTRNGSSHCFKYMRLESYEDTLNNLVLEKTDIDKEMREEYLLKYSLDIESRDSLLMLDAFRKPFGYTILSRENNELMETEVELVETFNYLIGLQVETMVIIQDFVVVTGKTLDEKNVLVIWRDMDRHSNSDLNEFCRKMRFNPLDYEWDRIYVNGDNNIENMKVGDERWKVGLIEYEFHKRMWEGDK